MREQVITLERLEKRVGELCNYLLIKNFKILGIEVSTAGSVDMITGEIILTNKVLLGYVGTNWKKIFESKFSIKTIVLNDAKAAGIAEFENKSFTNGVMVTLGTGFGVAIFVNKKLYTGSNYSAGEVGQMVWPFDNSKIVDFACSAGLPPNKITEVIKDKAFKLTEYAKIANNKEALKIKEDWMKNFAYTLQFLNFFYDPDLYIVGGGVSKHKELIYEILNFLPKNFKKVEIATRGNDAAIYGLIIAMNQK